jgi:hypothetical protein
MNRMIVVLGIALLTGISVTLGQQDSTWESWDWLVGDWVGEGSGAPGEAAGWFSVHPLLDRRILMRKGHAEYPESTGKPRVIHDDLLIIYADPAGQPSKAIYFDNEGHVINYSISYPGKSIVLTSDRVENIPVFRLTYSVLDSDGVKVKFEMSKDGERFITYTDGKCRKTQLLR